MVVMTDDLPAWVNDIHAGDVNETLSEIPESSVHFVMTSPPYYGLRDYGEEGQIGLEQTLDDYIDAIVDVGESIRRVIREDGSWWLNLGDTFAGSQRGQWNDDEDRPKESVSPDSGSLPDRETPLRRKSKMLVPHRVAIALQEAGWIIRSDAVWAKPNPMPTPAKDRLNEEKEFLFHLTPSQDYFFDLDAIREAHAERSLERMDEGPVNADTDGRGTNDYMDPENLCHPNGKNPGDIMEVTTKPFPDAHFAVYPPELCELPIKSSCPTDVCADCGTPYDHTDGTLEQGCDCSTDETEPGIVLDPFAGAGTTCMVAKDLGRRFVGIDINPEYVAMAQKRVGIDVDQPEYIMDDDDQHTFESAIRNVAENSGETHNTAEDGGA